MYNDVQCKNKIADILWPAVCTYKYVENGWGKGAGKKRGNTIKWSRIAITAAEALLEGSITASNCLAEGQVHTVCYCCCFSSI